MNELEELRSRWKKWGKEEKDFLACLYIYGDCVCRSEAMEGIINVDQSYKLDFNDFVKEMKKKRRTSDIKAVLSNLIKKGEIQKINNGIYLSLAVIGRKKNGTQTN